MRRGEGRRDGWRGEVEEGRVEGGDEEEEGRRRAQ